MENKKAIYCITFSSNKYWMEKTKVKFVEAVEKVFSQYEFSVGYTRNTLEKKLKVLAEAAEGFQNLTIKHRDLIIQHPKSAKEWFEYLENLLVLQGVMYSKHSSPLFVDGKMKTVHWRLRVKAPVAHSEAEKAMKKDIEDYLAGLERLPNYKPVYFEKKPHAGADPF